MISNIYLSIETLLLVSVAALYIIHCPFNKVEESFNTQAVHDIVNLFPTTLPAANHIKDTSSKDVVHQEIANRYQLPWDHTIFPGVVPRTFVGALLIGLPLKLAKYFLTSGYVPNEDGGEQQEEEEEHDLTMQFVLQIGSRFALSSLVVLSISAITRALHKKYGMGFRLVFLITTIGQFHYLFYAGRFIPNTFAAILANLMFAAWINRQYSLSIIYVALCVIIFRFDTAIFFGWLLFDGVFIRRFLSLSRVLKVGIPAGFIAILITFSIDSFFWIRPVWPELEGLYFNVWLNKSHQWGTEPFFWYTYNCLPRIMMASAPFILFAEHKVTRDYLIPVLAFILTYSLLPHKELRFILFITPLLNICVTSGLMNVYYYINKTFSYMRRNNNNTQKSFIATILFSLLIIAVFSANIFGCLILSRISSHNYPGGQAALSLGMTKELLDKVHLTAANHHYDNNFYNNNAAGLQDPRSNVAVYVNNLAAQTGLSRFVQVNGVYYSKTPKLDESSFKKAYELIYLILEPQEVSSYLKNYCPIEINSNQLFAEPDKWRKSNTELKCTLPNQSQMYCSIIDSVNIFKSINLGGLIKRLKGINSLQLASESLDDKGFIRTRVALHIIRCSTKSKFNPFS